MTVFLVCLAALLVLCALWLFLIFPASPRGDFSRLRAFDYAHRGLHDKARGVPENSLLAFRGAVEAGYGIEWDVQLTRDRKVVIHHDRSLKRLCGEDVSIGDLTFSELQNYRLLGTEERVPLFSDALKLVSGRVPLIIELKDYDDTETLCPLVWEILKDYKGDYCVESFSPAIVAWFRKNHPHVIRGQLGMHFRFKGLGGVFKALCMNGLLTNVSARPHFEAWDIHARNNPALRTAVRFLGAQEVSWTLRSAEDYALAKNAGALCIFENIRPELSDSREH